MVEKYKGPSPDGQNIGTWYRLSKQEVLKAMNTGHIPRPPGHRDIDLEDADLFAIPGKEADLEKLITSWGLKIILVRKG